MTPSIDPTRKVISQSELARHLGLSEWTVSRAINGHPAVKESTRDRVLKAMRELGFRPDPLARGLSGKGTGMIGISFNELRHPILLEKLALLESFLFEHNFRSVLAFTRQNEESELRTIADFRRLRVDAVVLVNSTLSATKCASIGPDLKLIHLDPIVPQQGTSVSVDRNFGVELLVDHLFNLGHRYFGTLGILKINSWRWLGLVKALKKHRLDPAKHLRQYLPPDVAMEASYEMGIYLAEQVLADPSAPTALLALNDRVALSAAQHLARHGAPVPGRFSVTGFDHLNISRHLHPTLTTIDHEAPVLMEAAGRLLLQKLEENAEPENGCQVMIKPSLIVGESTGPAPGR